jgi:glutathione S-transferase
MIKFYWCPNTRAARIAWFLEELGEPFEPVKIDIRDADAPRDPDFAKASPMGKVPAISIGDAHLSDSAAIALYLADRFPEAVLAPALHDPSRAQYLYWMVFTPGFIEPAMAERLMKFPTNKAQLAWGDYPSVVATVETGLSDKEWLLGDTFCAADVLVGSIVNFMKMFGAMDENPILEAYLERCLARPAFQRAIAMNEAA